MKVTKLTIIKDIHFWLIKTKVHIIFLYETRKMKKGESMYSFARRTAKYYPNNSKKAKKNRIKQIKKLIKWK